MRGTVAKRIRQVVADKDKQRIAKRIYNSLNWKERTAWNKNVREQQ